MIVATELLEKTLEEERIAIKRGTAFSYLAVMNLLKSPGEQYEKARFKLVPMYENTGFRLVRVEDAE